MNGVMNPYEQLFNEIDHRLLIPLHQIRLDTEIGRGMYVSAST
jgi:hypothetical protein